MDRQLLIRLQQAAAAAARRMGDCVDIGPFTVTFSPMSDMIWTSYAVPRGLNVTSKQLAENIPALRAEFTRRHRVPRFEHTHEILPDLAAVLEANGFRRQLEVPLMVCTPDDLPVRAATSSEIRVEMLSANPDRTLLRAVLAARDRAFVGEGSPPPTEAQMVEFETLLGSGALEVAVGSVGNDIAGMACLTAGDSVRELAGVGTDPAFRRRGVARTLSLHLTRRHLDAGGEAVWLSAGDETARSVYERVGFRVVGTQLHYIDAAWNG